MCNPLKIRTFDKCVVYSFGLNNELSFEEGLQQISGGKCLIRSFAKVESSINYIHGGGKWEIFQKH